ncbi:MAG TPA: DEAD/DEAH box helicase [Chloroflexota bacterium]
MPSVLRPWQIEGATAAIQALDQFGGAYLQWDPGMGKTLGTLAIARYLKLERIVVVCPVVAKGVWVREIHKWWPGARAVDIANMDAIESDWPTFVLVSYDKLIDPVPADPRKVRTLLGRDRLHTLLRWTPDLAIFDEAHYIKDYKTKRSRAAAKLAAGCRYRLLLSGTPAHSPLDWWQQYRIIDGRHPMWSQAFQRYREDVLVLTGPNGNWPKRGPDGRPMMKPGAQNRILNAMAPYTHHADASLVHLPEPIESLVPVPLSPTETKHYREMAKYLRTEIDPDTEAQAMIVLTKMLRLSQITAGFVTDEHGVVRDLGTSKLDACLELLEERSHQKVVVSCRFAHDIQRLSRALEARKVDFKKIDGGTPEKQRPGIEDWFQKTPGPKVLLLQQRAGGVAITLSEADCLIFFTLENSVVAWRQTWGRVWRIGQKGHVQIMYLLGNNTQDEVQLVGLKEGANMVTLARMMLNQLRRQLNGR